jgi:hypothetical protein
MVGRFHLEFTPADPFLHSVHYPLILTAAIAVEVIQFEVLRRLHFGHGLSLEDIDATCVLPPLRLTNRFGLIYAMTQRCVGLRRFYSFTLLNAGTLT